MPFYVDTESQDRNSVDRQLTTLYRLLTHGNIANFLKDVINKGHFLLSHAKFSEEQTKLFDEDVIQSILAKLPVSYNAFVIAQRSVEQYTMTFFQFG